MTSGISGSGVTRRATMAGVVLLMAGTGVAQAATHAQRDVAGGARPVIVKAAGTKPKSLVLRVVHGPLTSSNAQHVDAAPAGPSVGDLRTFYVPVSEAGGDRRMGYIAGTLTTVTIDRPKTAMELRTANLVFVIGRAANQLVVGGVSAYEQATPTISKRSVTTRPVIGGSGRYASARGWCVSKHRSNGTWIHVFHVTTGA